MRDLALAGRELFAMFFAVDRDEALAIIRQREGGEHERAHSGAEEERLHFRGGEFIGGIDFLAQARQVSTSAGEFFRERHHQYRQVRVVRRLRDVGKFVFGEALILEKEMGVFTAGREIGQRPKPAVGADHPAEAIHEVAFGDGVVGMQAGDFGDQPHQGACFGFGDRGIHRVASRGLVCRRESAHQLGVRLNAEGRVDVLHVAGDGMDRDAQLVGDEFAAVAFEQEIEHEPAAGRQGWDFRPEILRPAEGVQP